MKLCEKKNTNYQLTGLDLTFNVKKKGFKNSKITFECSRSAFESTKRVTKQALNCFKKIVHLTLSLQLYTNG